MSQAELIERKTERWLALAQKHGAERVVRMLVEIIVALESEKERPA